MKNKKRLAVVPNFSDESLTHQRGKTKCKQMPHFLTPRRTITRAKMTTAFYDGARKAFHVVSPDKNDEVSTCSTSATTVRMSNCRKTRPSNVVCETFSPSIFLESSHFAHPHITVGSAVALAQVYLRRSCLVLFKGIRQDLTRLLCLLFVCFSGPDPA